MMVKELPAVAIFVMAQIAEKEVIIGMNER